MQKMSKGFYIGGYFAGAGVSIVLMVVVFVVFAVSAAQRPNDEPPIAILGFLILAMLPMFFSVVVLFMFIYRMWESIQDGHARMTPGKAVGFMLIPFFNLYWIFPVYQGFAQDYNQYIARRQLNLPRLDEQLFLYHPIAILCSIIPFLGGLASIAAIVLLVIIISKTCDAVNALSNAPQLPTATASAAGI
jgi:hypothetical protein